MKFLIFLILFQILKYNFMVNCEFFVSPIFEIYKPKGIRVSLTVNHNNMKNFNFHGNKNKLIQIGDEGEFHCKGTFITSNKYFSLYLDSPEFKVGDKIYYWFEYELNNNKEKHINVQPFEVEYLIPTEWSRKYGLNDSCNTNTNKPTNKPLIRTPRTKPPSTTCNCDEIPELKKDIEKMKNEMFVLSRAIRSLSDDLIQLKALLNDEFAQAEEQSNKQGNENNRELLLTSEKPFPNTTPIEEVRFIVGEKLELGKYEGKITHARYTTCGIIFEMTSVFDKKYLLAEAKRKLQNYHINIAEPNEDVCILHGKKLQNLENHDETQNVDSLIHADIRFGKH